jgi:organic radical activating enzyme
MSEKNQQLEVSSGNALPLMEAFYTIQGEGYHKGAAAYFIRVGGCDVGCHWCDVKESWDAEKHPPTSVDEIVAMAAKHKTIVVTGGEPLMWPMDPLTTTLKDKGLQTHIETSGSYPLSGDWDWICLSPKKTAMPLEGIYSKADELKIIVYNKHDLKFAMQEAEKVSQDCKLFLQPEWSVRDKVIPLIVDFVMEHPQWKVSLQTHKYMNIP